MKISDHVLALLSDCTTQGNCLTITAQLARPDYVALNKVLELAGGKWDRKSKAHVFSGNASDAIEPVVLTGEITDGKKELGQFFTPPDLAVRVVQLAGIEPGDKVLEPSAGNGALVRAARAAGGHIWAYEIDPVLHKATRDSNEFYGHFLGGGFACKDFLGVDPAPVFKKVAMNPPFDKKRSDLIHVRHAYKFLQRGGKLVAIMSAGVMFRPDALSGGFRLAVEKVGGSIERLPDDSFKESGTSVSTCIVQMYA